MLRLLLSHKTNYAIGLGLIAAGVLQELLPIVHIQIDGYGGDPAALIAAGVAWLSGHTAGKLGIKWNAPGAGNP